MAGWWRTASSSSALELWDYRRRVSAIYEEVRRKGPREEAWMGWRAARDELFATHPQSAVDPEARSAFVGLSYFPYDPAWRLEGQVEQATDDPVQIGQSSRFRRLGVARFEAAGQQLSLALYWLDTYGGGVFLPFRDATSGAETYGGGRYLLDTAKGADLGHLDTSVVLDFNFAYHPSCVHSPRWSCPLAPPENTLPVPVRAGERLG